MMTAIVLCCSRGVSDRPQTDAWRAAVPGSCATAVVGDFVPGDQQLLASEELVNRTIARIGLAYISAIEFCRVNDGVYPASGDELIAYGRTLPLRRTRCARRASAELTDEWGAAFVWSFENGQLVLSSVGPDGRPGTEDDIVSPPPPGVAADTVDVAKFCSITGS